jgi:hypothetical protein
MFHEQAIRNHKSEDSGTCQPQSPVEMDFPWKKAAEEVLAQH